MRARLALAMIVTITGCLLFADIAADAFDRRVNPHSHASLLAEGAQRNHG